MIFSSKLIPSMPAAGSAAASAGASAGASAFFFLFRKKEKKEKKEEVKIEVPDVPPVIVTPEDANFVDISHLTFDEKVKLLETLKKSL